MLRQEASIPNYHQRREKFLLKAIDHLMSHDPKISLRKLTIELNKEGFEISTFGLRKYSGHLEEKRIKNKVNQDETDLSARKNKENKEDDSFTYIIGKDGSLKNVIKMAKAAILYPPNGLHTLIVGNTGSGKSQLVEGMHQFAKNIRRKNSNIPFVIFNCADYSDNPQLLVSQLFGHSKGSFTGAIQDKPGLVEKANGGILFLDEIHRLPPNGQEILFRIIDKGEFSRLGETSHSRKVNVMIIGATTENLESTLLITFRRRIPFLIEIPSLEDRPVIERLKLIHKFFAVESTRIRQAIYISKDIIEILLFYTVPGNIGQLRSDIQVICAEALLTSFYNNHENITISMNDLPKYIINQLLEIKKLINQHNGLIINDLTIFPNKEDIMEIENYIFKDSIFQLVDRVADKLTEYEKESSDIKAIKEMESMIEAYILDVENRYSRLSKESIESIVGIQIINIVESIYDQLLSQINISKSASFNILCVHIAITFERMKMGKPAVNFYLEHIQQSHPKTYDIALKVTEFLSEKTGWDISEDEAGFLTLYLNYFQKKNQIHESNKVGVIIATHGDVGTALLQTAQSLTNIYHGISVTIGFDDDQHEIIKKLKSAIKESNEDKGILLLVDMGSLVNLGEILSEELNVPIKTIPRVDTLMAIDAINKSALSSSSLESIYNSILKIEKSVPFRILQP